MKMDVPESLSIRVYDGDAPVEGMLVLAELRMTRKNHHSIMVGPTDTNGRASVDRSAVLEEADIERNFFLMDYADVREHFAGTIEVSIMGRAELERALGAYELFGKAGYRYPPDYQETLRRALSRIRESGLDGRRLRVEVSASSPDVRITVKGD